MYELHYRPMSLMADELREDECLVHRAMREGARYWLFWWRTRRQTDGALELFCVPILPHEGYSEAGPGGRSWGVMRVGAGRWALSPSVNVLDDQGGRQTVAGFAPTACSLWHQTPIFTGVPEDEPWAKGEAA